MSDAATSYYALGDVADTNVETLSANTPSSTRFRYIDLSAVEAGFINWGSVTETTFGDAPSRARRVVRGLDILFGTVRPNLQTHGLIDPNEQGPLIASTGFSVVCGREGISHPGYLFHSLMSRHVTAQAVRDAIGSSYPALNDSDVKRLQIFLPSYGEQQKISQILDTLDTAIHETEAIIAKLKAVKQGLLHDLLTRGIAANGELRPPQTEAPHLYKLSPLGWIPKEWDTSTVANSFCVDSGITLGPHRLPRSNAHPYLRVANVYRARLHLDDVAQLQASAAEMKSKALRVGDLLLVEGHASVEEIGRCALVTEAAEGMLFQNHLFRLRAISVSPNFGLLWLNSAFVRNYWRNEAATSSGLNTINRTKLSRLGVALPTQSEQEAIATCADTANAKLAAEEYALTKWQQQKSALMDDLLTGRVRVTPLLEAAAP